MEIVQATPALAGSLPALFSAAKKHLRSQGIKQWDFFYPNSFLIRNDVKKGELYGILEDGRFIAAVTLNTVTPRAYEQISWTNHRALIIHRLVVSPAAQGRGIGMHMLSFCENFARAHQYDSIHLDAYTDNAAAVSLYDRNGYQRRGEVRFPMRRHPFICFEKVL
ncbi:UNVERIFIED_CONTAM: ribosomal protein S18 acetylase RimI-like enzyme [Brevibacillus sp. OAP136]